MQADDHVTRDQEVEPAPLFDLSLGLEGSVAIVTGAAGQIGRVIVDALLTAGCHVGAFDINPPSDLTYRERLMWTRVDITDGESVRSAWSGVTRRSGGHVPTICICAAGLDLSFIDHHQSAADMSVAQFRRTLDVNTTGTFITAKTWLSHLRRYIKADPGLRDTLRNVSLVIIGSEAGVLGVPSNADYATSKSAIQYGLTKSLAPDAARIFDRAIVNAIAPGAVDTPQFKRECAADPGTLWIDAQATVVSRKPVAIEHVARTCLLLASEKWSGSTTGQVIRVDGGKSGRLFWDQHGAAI